MAKYLLVGDAPTTDEVGVDGWLLPDGSGLPTKVNGVLSMMGWSLDDYLAAFVRTHVTDWVPSAERPYSPQAARKSAASITRSLAGGALQELEGVLVLGRRAGNAFNWWAERLDGALGRVSAADLDSCRWYSISTGGAQGQRTRVAAALLPYPSKLQEKDRERAREFFAGLRGG
jgi:hypothetical protein